MEKLKLRRKIGWNKCHVSFSSSFNDWDKWVTKLL